MNCANCGAAMELFERRRYFFCRYCGTFHFIAGDAADGVRVLDRPAGGRPCAVCESPLAVARLDDAHGVEHCERCRGLLLTRTTFAEAVARRRAMATGPPAAPVPLDRRELDRPATCPSCRIRMDVHPYYGPGNVVIDTCRRCDLVWLDYGELQQITDAPGNDRGRPPASAPRSSSSSQDEYEERPAWFDGPLGDLFS